MKQVEPCLVTIIDEGPGEVHWLNDKTTLWGAMMTMILS